MKAADVVANKVVMEEVVETAGEVATICEMGLVGKDVDILARAISENIPKSIQESTDAIEATMKEVAGDVKTRFELMESKMKVSELSFSIKITTTEENLGNKID
ncbi:hypothetical protein Dimus_016490 [Dionaea muscipula]